ncbi:hypothetical protein [Jeotgalibacillus soli]|uniref:GGDEF domain-containing protein n=1 Tax=Jeotgalibacillus soli TaxID=889306 RepID=A0A0C2V6J6_9BACL|nr:hypothetical protein [Jeotgalibacillus soli]KIL44587.1 hypothetical protein KP78_35510 [Jeotgalibacillus soli]
MSHNSIAARIGGDELILLVPEDSAEQLEAKAFGDRLLHTLSAHPVTIEGHDF